MNNVSLYFLSICKINYLFIINTQQNIIGNTLTVLTEVDSSNNYAMQQIYDGKAAHGNAYMALCQTNGKGQLGKQWYTGKNANLALSIVVEPSFLQLNNAFMLHTFVCVSLIQYFKQQNVHFSIKWPNDLYYNDRKAAGILIENIVRGNTWKYAVIGIGLNVNDNLEHSNLHNATSLQQITKQQHDVALIATGILNQMQVNWNLFKLNTNVFYDLYNKSLYKKNENINLIYKNDKITTIIKEVTTDGKLICGTTCEFNFAHGEVDWVLK